MMHSVCDNERKKNQSANQPINLTNQTDKKKSNQFNQPTKQPTIVRQQTNHFFNIQLNNLPTSQPTSQPF